VDISHLTSLTLSRLAAKLLLVLSICCVFNASLYAASGQRGLYRWVDDQGVVHYGDHVPAKYAKKERQILNRQAVVVNVLKAQKTQEQLAKEAVERERVAELRRLATEKAHRDRILLATYATPQDIDQALTQAQQQIDGRINVININIANLQEQRSTILDRITYFNENSDEAADDTITKLEAQLTSTNDELTNAITLRNKLKVDRNALADKYNNDKTQFVKLKLQRNEDTMAENHPLL